MNIFILSTGRCGSTTFIEACRHITNYTCAHESRTGLLGEDRLDYPENHIEADNRLSWLLGRLETAFGDDAFYVHLRREESDVARSFVRRYRRGIIKAYRGDGILRKLPEESDPLTVALDYCHTVNSNIEHFVKEKTRQIVVDLGNVDNDFTSFWKAISAEGELDAALKVFETRHNASPQRAARATALRRLFLKLKGGA